MLRIFDKLLEPREKKRGIEKSRSGGTTDWMEQTGLGTLGQPGIFSGQSTANIDYSVQNSSWSTDGGTMVTNSTPSVQSNTYTLSSALSMK